MRKKRLYLSIKFFVTFIFLTLFTIGFTYTQDKSDIMWGTAFVTMFYFLFAFVLSRELLQKERNLNLKRIGEEK